METILNWLTNSISYVGPFVLLLGVLIFVHELGHFLMARFCGVRVETFSLGFGKKIFSYKKGHTTYCISLFPLGGYVKMFGENPGDEINAADQAESFTHKTVYQRIAIVLAGPLMNFFFSIFILFVLALVGEKAKPPIIGDVFESSYAYEVGFRSGDRILKVNQKSIETFEEFSHQLNVNYEKNITFEVRNGDLGETRTISASVKGKPNPNILSVDNFIGEIEGINSYSLGTSIGLLPDSPLRAFGLVAGDKIIRVNGVATYYWRDLQKQLENANSALPLDLEIAKQSDEKITSTLSLAPGTLKAYNLTTLGIISSETFLAKVNPGSPAEKAGLMIGDRLVQIGETPILKWENVVQTVKSFSGTQALVFKIEREGQFIEKLITPEMTEQTSATGAEDKRYTIGIYNYVNYVDPELIVVRTNNPFKALVRGIEKTYKLSVMTVLTFVRIFENKISPKNIGGVISIGQIAGESFRLGIDYFLQMMALISVNLFILNLLPIPVLDGGHMVFYTIELIKGSPVSLKNMMLAQQVGMILLMSLMVFALFNDFTRVFSGM